MVLGELDWCMQKNETRPPTYTIINSKWIKDLNINHDTIKILEENRGRKISDISCSNGFFFANISPRARKIKEENKQMGLHQTKKLLHS